MNRKILYGLVVLMIIVVLFLIKPDPKVLNSNVDFVGNNKVINSLPNTYVDTLMRVGLDVMGIDSVLIFVTPFNESIRQKINERNDLDVHALIEGNGNVYYVYVKDMSFRKTTKVLSHELVHLEQKLRGDLTVTNDGFLWKNTYYPNTVEYQQRPWEREAFKRESDIQNKIEKIIYR